MEIEKSEIDEVGYVKKNKRKEEIEIVHLVPSNC